MVTPSLSQLAIELRESPTSKIAALIGKHDRKIVRHHVRVSLGCHDGRGLDQEPLRGIYLLVVLVNV